jgi:cell division protein DivIC
VANTKSKVKLKRRVILLGTLSLGIIGTILFSMGKNIYEIYNQKKEEKKLAEQLLKLKSDEEDLKAELEKLKDPEYVARYAREKYLYSKDGEFIIRIP